ncbi:ComEC/Rec2 family competence protein [Acaryochloris marina]|uniref:Competence protein, putative n=1 Tax=Acaryochloris marina (strain MBIC 11017) TaxID=329726 RepID=B0BZU7_ACAM1|nr:ComEC/Rec2 family competence protein [Acaryochloris marina]ABW27157.1 competence protein, putative [Acaryochloris marina MBIC11017]BDM81911.1 competence protein [Acaryochloris marina MBIC10699]
MQALNGAILCIAWIVGLLSTAHPYSWLGLIGLGLGLMGMRVISLRVPWPLLYPWRRGPRVAFWLLALACALFASLYFSVRTPTPGSRDISRIVPEVSRSLVTVTGKVETMPRLTRSQTVQFQLQALKLEAKPTQKTVRGLLYVSLPPKQGQKLHPGQRVEVSGYLYKPRRSATPQGFDFEDYLTRSGIFAGLRGKTVTVKQSGGTWGGWAVRQRIVRSHARFLGPEKGALVSAMVLGHRRVDLPFNLRNRFVKVGLAHTLAASGFHVSIILAGLLKVTGRLSSRTQLISGLIGLIIFIFLSGFEPSVSRAVLMGMAGLAAVTANRKLNPVGVLLVVAVGLLVIQPQWIWDLGFQLSFLATLGLIVTVPPLTQKLDWLPPAISSLFAVPIAAMLWTLPLQLYQFGIAPIYCLLANICTTPLLILLTAGGFCSGIVAVMWPLAGGLLAWLLAIPTQGLIWLVTQISLLPGASLTLGTLSIWQLVLLYGLLVSAWLLPVWKQRLPLLITLALGIIILPIWHYQVYRFQITIFDRATPPMMVIQQPGSTLVLNSGDRNTASQTLVPFLQRQGIDQVDLALATDLRSRWRDGWPALLQQVSLKKLIPISLTNNTALQEQLLGSQVQPGKLRFLQVGEQLVQDQTQISVLRHQPTLLQFTINQQNWLMVSGRYQGLLPWLQTTQVPSPQVLWWSTKVDLEAIHHLQPQVLILTSRNIDAESLSQLERRISKVYWTPRDGAVQWTRDRGFESTFPLSENPASPL